MNFTGLCSVASLEKTACLKSATVDSFAEIPNTEASIFWGFMRVAKSSLEKKILVISNSKRCVCLRVKQHIIMNLLIGYA